MTLNVVKDGIVFRVVALANCSVRHSESVTLNEMLWHAGF